MSVCNVVAVLSDDTDQIRETFNTAVEPVKTGSRESSALEAALQSNAVTGEDQTWRSRVLSVPRPA